MGIGRNVRSLQIGHRFFQPLDVGGEILRDVYAAIKIGDRNQPIGGGIGVDKFSGSDSRLGLIGGVHGGVVKKQNHVARPGVAGRRRALLERKTGDGLLFAIFPNFEVLLGEIANVVSFFIGDHGVDKNFTRFYTKHVGVGLRFGGGLLRVRHSVTGA